MSGITGFARNEQALQQERDRLEREAVRFGNDAPMLFLRSGSTMVRILNAWDPSGAFFKHIYKHNVRYGDQRFEGLCPLSTNDEDCPICNKAMELATAKDEATVELVRGLKPRNLYLYNVICLQGPANKKGVLPEFGKVYVLEGGVTVHRQIMEIDQDEGAGWANITDVEKGVTLIIKRTGSGLDTRYDVNPTLVSGQPRSNLLELLTSRGVDPATLALNNLDEVYKMPDAATLEEVAKKIRGPVAPKPAPTFQVAQAPQTAPAFQAAPAPASPAVPASPAPLVAAPQAPVEIPEIPAPPVNG